MSKPSIILKLSPHLFWEIERSGLIEMESKSLIIQRVLEYGLIEDWHLIRDYYESEGRKEKDIRFKICDLRCQMDWKNLRSAIAIQGDLSCALSVPGAGLRVPGTKCRVPGSTRNSELSMRNHQRGTRNFPWFPH